MSFITDPLQPLGGMPTSFLSRRRGVKIDTAAAASAYSRSSLLRHAIVDSVSPPLFTSLLLFRLSHPRALRRRRASARSVVHVARFCVVTHCSRERQTAFTRSTKSVRSRPSRMFAPQTSPRHHSVNARRNSASRSGATSFDLRSRSRRATLAELAKNLTSRRPTLRRNVRSRPVSIALRARGVTVSYRLAQADHGSDFRRRRRLLMARSRSTSPKRLDHDPIES